MLRKIFSHTPDEARSVGLAKVCVFQKIYSVIEKVDPRIDSYVTQIRQVATLLGYEEPQILEVFKNTLPTKLYWILFPTEDLRQAVEIAKKNTNQRKTR